jgi:hypothetical protein
VLLGLALLLGFQGLFGLFASGRVDRVADEFEVYLMAESLVDRGSVAIPQVPPPVFFGRVGRDGQPYAPYGPGSAVLSVPHHLIGRAVAGVAGVPREEPAAWTPVVAAVTSLASSTWGALAVLALYAFALQLGASEVRAAGVAGLLGGATFLWPTATTFYSEPQSAALLLGAIVLRRAGRPLLVALAVAGLLLVKASNVILIPALLVEAAWPRPGDGGWSQRLRAAAPALFGIYVVGLVRIDANLVRFGDPFELGYSWAGITRAGEVHRPFALGEVPRGLVGLLLAPGKSVFLFAPPLALACARLGFVRRERPALFATWVAAASCTLLFFAAYSFWEGGFSFGPRHLLPVVPLLLAPLALGGAPGRRAWVAVLALGVLVNLPGTLVSFMEDQAPGGRPPGWVPPYYAHHLPLDPAVPPGRPLVRYRLGYTPFRPGGYPSLLAGHLTSPPPGSGRTGLDLTTPNLIRATGRTEGVPGWLPWALPLPFVGCLVVGGVLGRRLLREPPLG